MLSAYPAATLHAMPNALRRAPLNSLAGLLCLLALAAPAGVLAAPRIAPDFTAPEIFSGAPLSLAQYRGHVVLLEFWASWCGPCWRSFPVLDQMQERYARQGLVILGLSLDDEPADALRFAEHHDPRFTLLYDAGGKIADSYQVDAMPRSFLIDAGGRIVGDFEGFGPDLERELAVALHAQLER